MGWKASCVMDERVKFVGEYLRGDMTMAELCRCFGICRRVGYKWVERYEREGVVGLEDRSRAPHRHPNTVPAGMEAKIVAMKRRHMSLGPKKILAKLREAAPNTRWPVASTIGNVLKRHGLVVSRVKRRHASLSSAPLAHCTQANHVWSADFKGWFYTGDRTRCTPLTICDGHSRFFIRCQALSGHTGYESVRPLFDACFREMGLPERIRTDNGPPFASLGVGDTRREKAHCHEQFAHRIPVSWFSESICGGDSMSLRIQIANGCRESH